MFCSSQCYDDAWPVLRAYHVPPRADADNAISETMGVVQPHVDLSAALAARTAGKTRRAMTLCRRGRSMAQDALQKAVFGYELGVTMAGCKAHRNEAAPLLAAVAEEFRANGRLAMWAVSVAHAFALFASIKHTAQALPAWWKDEALLSMSRDACVAAAGSPLVWDMRGTVMAGANGRLWKVENPRTPQDFRAASFSFIKAAHLYSDAQSRYNASERAIFCHNSIRDASGEGSTPGHS